MDILTLRLKSRHRMIQRAMQYGITITDKDGPKGAACYIRDAILSGNLPCLPENTSQIEWLEQSDWWEQIQQAAERIGIEIP